ncbi:cilia- and flagella-associated protein 52-like [Procambarus clarkii]|uniref:cilia- and flagella-associated protein 52-like n=1 Tax=Procambarus clarkii TaxID=6728 RepID=UPI00374480CA
MRVRKIKDLQLLSAIGFTGKVVGGLHLQQDRGLVYPVGVGVGVWDRVGGRHALLHAHTRPVTALAVSSSGQIIVSAQDSDPGCQKIEHEAMDTNLRNSYLGETWVNTGSGETWVNTGLGESWVNTGLGETWVNTGLEETWARVVVWQYEARREYGSHSLHREEVAAVAVTAGEEYVASLGGVLDGYLVIWHLPTRRPLCSVVAAEAGLGTATHLCTAPRTPTLMVVGGTRTLRAWSLNSHTNRLTPTPISLGLLERNYTCLQVEAREELLYAGTTSGDVVKVRLNMSAGEEPLTTRVHNRAPEPLTIARSL